ncbi:Ubiquinone biosynthesis O-methyltransferase [compost metagenome]
MYISKSILQIPTTLSTNEVESTIGRYNDWFYIYNFSNGVSTTVSDSLVNTIHQTRADLVFPLLDEMFKDRWDKIKCIDIACNQGWFASQIALRGASEVIGFDIRDEHLERASTIKEISGIQNLSYVNKNLFEVKDNELGQFDVTLFLGLLYHLENPMGALRRVRSLTKNICVIETQVTRPTRNTEILNGSDTNLKQGATIGVFSSDEHHVEGGLSVVIVPTLDALYQMLYAVGFNRVYLAVPPKTMYSQYPEFDRVIVFAQV